MAAARASSTAVTLTSSSATGAFSETAGGAGSARHTLNIAAGMTSAMAYYSDSTAGTATITATAPGSGLTAATAMVTVSTGVIAITADSVTVSPALAKADDIVTVSARGTPGQTAMFSVGTIVTDRVMTEVTEPVHIAARFRSLQISTPMVCTVSPSILVLLAGWGR